MFENDQKGERCLVTGGAGFIGSHVVEALVKEGYEVRIFDLPSASTENLKNIIKWLDVVRGDLINKEEIANALEDIDIVVHLAGTTLPESSNQNPYYDLETNVGGTVFLLEKALEKGVRKIVFASSGGTVYGIPQFLPITETHPTFPCCSYGITKLTIEKYIYLYNHLYGLDYNILRVGNAYGERQRTDRTQGAIAVFLGKILNREPIVIWGDGTVGRDYIHISDVASAFVKAVKKNTTSKIFNIASGTTQTLNDILAYIKEITGRELDVIYEPARKMDVPVVNLDIRLAKKELEWQPKVTIVEGIKRTWEWLLSNVEEKE